jgi:hypothetical protein
MSRGYKHFTPNGVKGASFWVTGAKLFELKLPRQSSGLASRARTAALAAIPRFFLGLPSLFYGVEHLLHPEYVALSSAAKAHTRMDPRANFLELFCWRDLDTRRRLLTGE